MTSAGVKQSPKKMAQKNETPILVVALLVTVGLVGSGITVVADRASWVLVLNYFV